MFDQHFSTRTHPGSRKVVPVPYWRPYLGFSYLFDNPGNSLHTENNLSTIKCQIQSDPFLELYRTLAKFVENIGGDELINRFLFFPLPPHTYHVTVWDGVNVENLDTLSKEARIRFIKFLDGLPESLQSERPSIIPSSEFDKDAGRSWAVRFKCKDLRFGGETVLMAILEPADDSSREILNLIRKERERLDQYYATEYGKTENALYLPHVALGYFSNSPIANELWRTMSITWNSDFIHEVEGKIIQFESISLYAFSDMLTYFKRAK